MERYDLMIINRSFWPVYPVIGEGLLKVAEKLAVSKKISVVLQDHDNIKQNLKKFNRGAGVDFFSITAFSNSSSGLIKRTLDSIFFMFGVIFFLIKTRPKIVYVSTDPPILIPFIIALFSLIMNFKYIYHLQDIHPEASSVVIKLNKYLLSFLKKIDNFSIRQATILITLNEVMKIEILKRSYTRKKIEIIENPSIIFNLEPSNYKKKKGFVFTGNLGRLQRIPLLLDSIKEYHQRGGDLEFIFVGGGIFSKELLKLSKNIPLIKYHGKVTAEQAGVISSKYEWALAPIEDLVTRYSFPSKLSSYIHSEAKILAICGEETSVAHWVRNHKVGIVVKPVIDEIIKIFFAIENNHKDVIFDTNNFEQLKKSLSMVNFVKNITSKILLLNNE